MMIRILLVLLSLSFLQCDSFSGKEQAATHNGQQNEDEAHADPATVDMISRVKEAVSKIDVPSVPYILNSKKAEIIHKQIPNATGMQKIQLLFNYGNELMRAGNTEDAILIIQEVLEFAERLEPENAAKRQQKALILFTVKKQLALAYIRKAEQDNCINNHTNESCIMPFSEKAQHLQREGSERAIEVLLELLETNPTDNECQYLLNVAHMTLGQYPDRVPVRFRIPEKYFQYSSEFPKFSDIAGNLGVDVNNSAGGTCIDDFNNDGYLDIMASSWGFEDQIRYFENNGAGGFTDKTFSIGLNGVTGGLNLKHADYNNDGYLDFIILRGAWLEDNGKIPNSLIRNNGDGTFKDVTIESGLYSLNPTQNAVWADFNLDGWLDIFIANESTPESRHHCELYMNNADGTFSDVALEAGISALGFFKGLACGDLNSDRYPDIYLSNYLGENTLYYNTGDNDGTISFRKADMGLNVYLPERSFSSWIFDYNNDGHEDIFVSGYSTDDKTAANIMIESIKTGRNENRPYLYRNNGDGSFTDATLESHLFEPVATMGCNYGDLDNDGFLDFYLATGDPELYSIVPNKMYRNVAGSRFEDVTYTAGFGHIQKGHAVGFGDLDMDGDQDIYAVMGGAFDGDVFQNILFENPIGNKNSWINILLEGIESNRSAIGAKLVLTVDEQGASRKIFYRIGTGASFGGNSLMAEIGLGQAKVIDKIEVMWPNSSKTIDRFLDIEVNQVIKIKEKTKDVEQMDLPPLQFAKSEHPHHNHH